jgi:hypothetical protein
MSERWSDNRALSVAVTHALTVAISTILVSGLIVGAGALLESQEQSVGENQLEEIGSDAVTYINTFDRLNETGENVTVSAAPDYPERIVGSYRYTIQLNQNSLEVRSAALDRSVEYPIETDTNVTSSSVSGSDLKINLCEQEGIKLGECDP